jgi:hypothetical protein
VRYNGSRAAIGAEGHATNLAKSWQRSAFTMLAELRAEKSAELDGISARIIDEATAQLLDRLKNGDQYIVGGEVKRKPLSARDLTLVAAIPYDKRALARHEPTQIGIKREESDLPGLAAYLADYSKAHPIGATARPLWTGRRPTQFGQKQAFIDLSQLARN